MFWGGIDTNTSRMLWRPLWNFQNIFEALQRVKRPLIIYMNIGENIVRNLIQYSVVASKLVNPNET